ncbi:MAG: hypothetical protein M1826_001544 [Phylliscum demangeonii]|nr:MAG: hypothetical protein M1826_001544 [Phylliscum demangeonii]
MQLFPRTTTPVLVSWLVFSIAIATSSAAAETEAEAVTGLEHLKLAVRRGEYKALSAAATLTFPFPSMTNKPPPFHAATCAECMWVLRELTWSYDHAFSSTERVKSDLSLNTLLLSLKCSRLLASVDIRCEYFDYERDRTLESFPEELWNELAPIAEPRGRPAAAEGGYHDQSLALHHRPPPPTVPAAQPASAPHLRGWVNSVAHSTQDAVRRLGRIPLGAKSLQTPVKHLEEWILQHE